MTICKNIMHAVTYGDSLGNILEKARESTDALKPKRPYVYAIFDNSLYIAIRSSAVQPLNSPWPLMKSDVLNSERGCGADSSARFHCRSNGPHCPGVRTHPATVKTPRPSFSLSSA